MAKYSEDKAAGLSEIKAKIKGEVYIEQKRWNPRSGEAADSAVLKTTKEMAEAERQNHVDAIASLDELIADIEATPEA